MKWLYAIFFTLAFVFLLSFAINCFYGYFFPIKYAEEIAVACEEYNVDTALVASVINTESSYKENAISSKGAVGLMQLLPTTAEYLADKMGLEEYNLYTAKDNIKIGTYYLSLLIERFGSDYLALCAYNAGPTNVRNWLDEYGSEEEVIKNIPFEETENYLKKFQKNFNYYKHKREEYKTVKSS